VSRAPQRATGADAERFALRVLGPQDVAAARDMLGVFAEAFADTATYLERQPGDHYLQRLLASDGFVAIVAEANGRVVGALAGYVLPKFEQARAEFYLYDLAVAAEWRRRGIATGMVERLKRLAAARGIEVIFVQADPGDAAAIALYTRLGEREDVLHFDIAPSGAPLADAG
jgi:aminoglycoside 3-N-acetyltransferase I